MLVQNIVSSNCTNVILSPFGLLAMMFMYMELQTMNEHIIEDIKREGFSIERSLISKISSSALTTIALRHNTQIIARQTETCEDSESFSSFLLKFFFLKKSSPTAIYTDNLNSTSIFKLVTCVIQNLKC